MSEILSSETIEKMRKFNNNSKWLSAHYDDIKSRYTNKIIAIDNDTVIDYDEDINSLLKRLRERYTDIHHIVIQYVNDKQYPIT
jgi:ABC-type phosphate/phosphonate transport system ATPase subunit